MTAVLAHVDVPAVDRSPAGLDAPHHHPLTSRQRVGGSVFIPMRSEDVRDLVAWTPCRGTGLLVPHPPSAEDLAFRRPQQFQGARHLGDVFGTHLGIELCRPNRPMPQEDLDRANADPRLKQVCGEGVA